MASGELGNSMEMPYEPEPTSDAQLLDEHVHISGGVVVMASFVDVPEVGPKPALIFRFATPEGGFYPPVLLVMDDGQMSGLRPLINAAIHDSRVAARKAAG